MDKLHSFDGCKIAFRDYGGSDRKFGVIYNGDIYMLKFSEKHEKRDDFTTSYLNKPTSEYISSHIANAISVPAHETILGKYNDEIAVACKDFRTSTDRNIEFHDVLRSVYDPNDVKKIPKLDQIYYAIENSPLVPQSLKQDSIEHYWDTFILDALTGNFDRHTGNWGYVANDNEIKCSPVYDLGSTLFPQIADDGIKDIIENPYEIARRCLVFPSPALYTSYEKTGKVGYYDLLSSNYDAECTKALLRVVPNIDMGKIYDIIEQTPIITDVKKDFYKMMLTVRKELILDRAYERCVTKDFDKEALSRITDGKQFSDKLLEEKMSSGEIVLDLKEIRQKIYGEPDKDCHGLSKGENEMSENLEVINAITNESDLMPKPETIPEQDQKVPSLERVNLSYENAKPGSFLERVASRVELEHSEYRQPEKAVEPQVTSALCRVKPSVELSRDTNGVIYNTNGREGV